jgi:DNA-binding NarL/FixJ family response regulator
MTSRGLSGNGDNLALTSREVSILCLVAAGCTNIEVARRLHISRHTVAQHIAEMLRRAEARNRAELVARAYAEGMLSASSWPPSATGTG